MLSAATRLKSSKRETNHTPSNGDLRKIITIQSLFRGRKTRRLYAKKKENVVYRANVAREIQKTEEDYVKNLNIVIEHFLKPLKQRMEEEKSEDNSMVHFNSLFSDIQVIRNYNGNLLNDLQPRMQKWNAHQVIGDIFVQMSAFLKVYTQYVSRYNKAMLELTAYKKGDPRVLEMLKVITTGAKISEKEEVGNQEINSFLIRPIQRIPRYRLLLKDLLKHTEEDHNDFKALSTAYKQVSDVAEFIEEKASEAERIGKLLDVQSRLFGNFSSIAAPSRKYVREGRLGVGFVGDNKVKRERMVFLFNDLLVDTKPVKKSGVEVFQFKNSYHLVQLQPAVLPEDGKEFRFAFALRADGDTVDVVRFFAASAQERDEWIADLNSLRQDINAKRQHHNDLVLERAKKRAQKAKLAFSQRYRTTEDPPKAPSNPDGGDEDPEEGQEEQKPVGLYDLKGISPRTPNRWEKKLREHQGRMEERVEQAGVKTQGHQSRWELRLKAHQERLRARQGEDVAASASSEEPVNEEHAADVTRKGSSSPDISASRRKLTNKEKRASAELGGGSGSSTTTPSTPESSSPPSPRKSGGGLLSSLLRKRDSSGGGSSRRHTMSNVNLSALAKPLVFPPEATAGEPPPPLPPSQQQQQQPSPSPSRREKRNYRKTISVIDIATMGRLHRMWGSDAAMSSSSDGLDKPQPQPQPQPQQQTQPQPQQRPRWGTERNAKAESPLVARASSNRRIKSAAYDKATIEEMMRRELTESLGNRTPVIPVAPPTPTRTKNPFSYFKKLGSEGSHIDKDTKREREVININPIRGIHLIPTFAAAAAAHHASHAAANASHAAANASHAAPSPPSLELSASTSTSTSVSSSSSSGESTAMVSPTPVSHRFLTISSGSVGVRSQDMEPITQAGSLRQGSLRKLRPTSTDFSGRKLCDVIRMTDEAATECSSDEEWKMRKQEQLDEWKKEDKHKDSEKLRKAIKKERRKSLRQEKKEKEKEMKEKEKELKELEREEKRQRKEERKAGRKRPRSMDVPKKRMDDLLIRVTNDSVDAADKAEPGNDNNSQSLGVREDRGKLHQRPYGSAINLSSRSKSTQSYHRSERANEEERMGEQRGRSASDTRTPDSDGDQSTSTTTAAAATAADVSTVSTWMSAAEEEALTIEEIDRRIADLKLLRRRKLGASTAEEDPSKSTKHKTHDRGGSGRTGSREGDEESSSSSATKEQRSSHPRERREGTTGLMTSPQAIPARKTQSEEVSPVAASVPVSQSRSRRRSHTHTLGSSSSSLPSLSSPSSASFSADRILRVDSDEGRGCKEGKEREKEKDERTAARRTAASARKAGRPVSMEVSSTGRPSGLIDAPNNGGGAEDAKSLRTGSTSTAASATTGNTVATRSRRATLSSGGGSSREMRDREQEKEKERSERERRKKKEETMKETEKAKVKERKEKEDKGHHEGSSTRDRDREKDRDRSSGSHHKDRSADRREGEKRNGVDREEKEKDVEDRTGGGNDVEDRTDGGNDESKRTESKNKHRDGERGRERHKERGREKDKEKEKEKERTTNHSKDHSKEAEKAGDGKDGKRSSQGSHISGLAATSSSPADWEERKKDRTSSKQRKGSVEQEA